MSFWEEMMDEEAGRAHSRFAPSSLKRILLCPRSVALAEALGLFGKGSVYAAEGTVAHTVAEAYLRGDPRATQIGGHVSTGNVVAVDGHSITIDDDMHQNGRAYRDYVLSLMVPGDTLFVETTVSLDAVVGAGANMYGHLDGAIWSPSRNLLIVIDYKYGRGVRVIALDNDQLKAYGLGAMHSIPSLDPDDVKTVEAHVFQPRVPGHSAPDRMPAVDLLRWGYEEVAPVIASIMADGAASTPFVTGEHCRFCPAKAGCPAMRERATKAAQKAFGASPIPATGLSDNELADTLDEVDIVEPWFEAVRSEAKSRAMRGAQIRGRKIVLSQGRRVWRDEKAAEAKLSAQYAEDIVYEPRAFRSVAQIEKKVPSEDKADFNKLWMNKPSGHSLVPTSDPRPGVRIATAAEAFRNAPL